MKSDLNFRVKGVDKPLYPGIFKVTTISIKRALNVSEEKIYLLSLVPTWAYKFVAGSSPNFIAQNLLVGTTLKVRRLKFVTQNERGLTGDEISKSFNIYRRFVAFHL